MTESTPEGTTTNAMTDAMTRAVDMDDLGAVREALREQIGGCVRTGRITLASGKVTDFYFDGRTVALDPAGSVLIARLVLEELDRRPEITAIGGPTSGADPIVSATGVLAHQAGRLIKLFYVRKESKSHGMQRLVEGPEVPGGSKILLVDDVLTTGGSLVRAKNDLLASLEKEGKSSVEVVGAIVLVDREEGGRERLESEGLELIALFTRSDFSLLTKDA